jgi:dynactin complex subunit
MKKEEKISGWMEKLFMPKLNEITGEIKALHTRIDSVEKEIASLWSETKTEIDGLRNEMLSKFESLRKEMLSKFESVDSRFDSYEAMVEFKALLDSIKL